MKNMRMIFVGLALAVTLACTSRHNAISYQDGVKSALEQADLNDVTVTEDANLNTVTLGGTVHSADAKKSAGDIAKNSAGQRIVVNEITIEPVGAGSEAKAMSADLDDAIEKNYKAVLIANRLDRQHIRCDAKNGVLTLKGTVKSGEQRREAGQLAQTIPNVQQVLNQIDISR